MEKILESFDGWVDEITPTIIFVSLIDSDGAEYSAEIPSEKFKCPVDPVVIGIIFTMNVYDDGRIEYNFPPPYTQTDLDKAKQKAQELCNFFKEFNE